MSHLNKYLNVMFANRSFFMQDPYQTITGMGRQTIANRMMAMQGMASGQALASEMQTISVYGDVSKEVVINAREELGISADKPDPFHA